MATLVFVFAQRDEYNCPIFGTKYTAVVALSGVCAFLLRSILFSLQNTCVYQNRKCFSFMRLMRATVWHAWGHSSSLAYDRQKIKCLTWSRRCRRRERWCDWARWPADGVTSEEWVPTAWPTFVVAVLAAVAQTGASDLLFRLCRVCRLIGWRQLWSLHRNAEAAT